MAARYQSESRRPAGSPRPKGRENAKDTLCRNVLIYGHCRYEDQGCAFNHDPNKTPSAQPDSRVAPRAFNADSPAFTPASLSAPRGPAISSKAAAAAHASPFTPRQPSGTVTPSSQVATEPSILNIAKIVDFVPSFDQGVGNGLPSDTQTQFDPFQIDGASQTLAATQFNPYSNDSNAMVNNGGYYQPQQTYAVSQQTVQYPLQYHLYAPTGPHREDLLPYQKHNHDFFMPEHLRQELQKKSEATSQVMPNSQLPMVDHYHTLVALDTTEDNNAIVLGYPSWVYKATSNKNGKTYCLRRLKGYTLTNANHLRPVKDWKTLDNASIVGVRDVITTRAFGDSSLIFVTDYFPLSKTLVEQHFISPNRHGQRNHTAIQETILWSYIVQIASAIKTIHGVNLAARCLDPSKIIVTDKNRIRLNACSILDVVKFEEDKAKKVEDLQAEDFIHFGALIAALATNSDFRSLGQNIVAQQNALNQMRQRYSVEFVDTVKWLLTPPSQLAPGLKNIIEFLRGIGNQVIMVLDSNLHAIDSRTSDLHRELENGRLFRLVAKLGIINERPEYEVDKGWGETGNQYLLKLFRDYTFHQVDAEGKPVVDLAHIIRCLNNLDAGSEEKVRLTSRDEQNSFIISYKELKKHVNTAWQELQKIPKGRY